MSVHQQTSLSPALPLAARRFGRLALALVVSLALASSIVWDGPRAYAQGQPPTAAKPGPDKAADATPDRSKKLTRAERRKARAEAKKKAREERRKQRAERDAKAAEKKRARAEAKKKAREERRKKRAERAAKAQAEKQAKAEARRQRREERRKRREEKKAAQAAAKQRAAGGNSDADKVATDKPSGANKAKGAKVGADKAKAAKAKADRERAKKRAKAKRKRARKPVEAQPPKVDKGASQPLPVMVISLVGETPQPDSAHPLTDMLMNALTTRTGRPVETRTGTADTIDITGCSAESEECFDAVADVIGVEWMVFGAVEPAGKDGVPVSITRVNAKQRTYTTRQLILYSMTEQERRKEFAVRARAFLDDKPDPSAQYVVVPQTPSVTFGDRMSRVSGISWSMTGGGVVAIAVGAALLSAASGKQREVDDAAVANVNDFDRLVALERSGQRYTTWGNGLMIAGGIAAAVGVGLILKQGYFNAPEDRETKLTIVPGADSQGGLSVTLGGRF